MRANPGEDFVEQNRDEKHPLGVVEMGDRDDGQARFLFRRIKDALDIERLTFEPAGKRRRGEQIVQVHRQLGSVFRRVERFQIDRADVRDRRTVDFLNQLAEIDVAAGAPGIIEQRGKKDMLATVYGVGIDAHQRE